MTWDKAMALARERAIATGARYCVSGLRHPDGVWVYLIFRTGPRR